MLNKCIADKNCPDDLKTGILSPVYKKDSKSNQIFKFYSLQYNVLKLLFINKVNKPAEKYKSCFRYLHRLK